MLLNAFTSPLIADSGAITGWTITAVLTFFLIGLPTLYLLVLTLAEDDNAFDRRVRDIEQYLKLSQIAHAYASSKDVHEVLDVDASRPAETGS
jgi:sensor domain CHASE-containing protein